MGGVEMDTRTVDGSGWVRAVGDTVLMVGDWVAQNTDTLVLVAAGLLAAWLLLRLLTRP